MKRQTWAEIKARLKPGTRARMEAEASRLSEELHLAQLRKARGLTQQAVAGLLGVSQAEVSKMERRSELCVFLRSRSLFLTKAISERGGFGDELGAKRR